MKFFRSSRQAFLSENKFSKYLIYVIGEIILVVIGILIALYLNNRKEQNITHERQLSYLKLIRAEVIYNIEALSAEDEALLSVIESNRLLISLINSNIARDTIEEQELSEYLLLPISRAIEVDYESGAFNELTSSGGLKEIENDSIRGMLASWESKLHSLRLQENALHTSLVKSNDYVETYGHFDIIFDDVQLTERLGLSPTSNRFSNMHLLDSAKFKNILLNYYAIAVQLHDRNYPRFRASLEKLLHLINIELQNNK